MKINKFITKCVIILLVLFSMLFQSVTAEWGYSRVAGAPDTQAPIAPKELTATYVTFTSAALTWQPAADNVGIKGYEIYCNGKKVASTSSTVYEYKKLSPSAAYLFYVKAYDKAGNYSIQSNCISVKTQTDKTAPSVPSGLKASSVSVTEVNLIWAPSSDNVNIGGYDIFRNGVKIGTTSKTSYSNKKLIPGKSYTYTVRASDISGNLSISSAPLTVNTTRDSQAPTAPKELKITAIKGASVSLEWIASTDNSKIAGYQIYCNGIVIATAAGTSRIVKSPFSLSSDVYYIKAYDIAGNLSAGSNTVTAVIASE
jgi:chitodextrinase